MYENDKNLVELIFDKLLVNIDHERRKLFVDVTSPDMKRVIREALVPFLSKCCDEERLHKIHECVDAGETLKTLTTKGLLNCNPICIGDTLVYGYGKNLRWFRNMYFQFFVTPSGRISEGNSCSTFGGLLDASRNFDDYDESCSYSRFIHSLFALTSALQYYKQTMRMLQSSEGVKQFGTFLSASAEKYFKPAIGATAQDVLNYVSVCDCFDEGRRSEWSNVLILDKNGNHLGIITLSTQTLLFYYCTKEGMREARFQIPSFMWGVNSDDEPYLTQGMRLSLYNAMVEFILRYSGIYTTYYTQYSVNKSLVPGTYNIRDNAINFNDISNFILDFMLAL